MYNFLQIYPGYDTENVLKGPGRGMKGYVLMFAAPQISCIDM